MPKYSITIEFDGPNEMAGWLQNNTLPTHSSANVNRNTGEVNGGASVNANTPNTASVEGDPWADYPDATTTNPVPSTSAATKVRLHGQKGDQDWTFNSSNAPMCGCNNPAAFVDSTPSGTKWKRWCCAKAAPDGSDNWKNKCDFNEFVGGRGK
jgi:hypothetical protein